MASELSARGLEHLDVLGELDPYSERSDSSNGERIEAQTAMSDEITPLAKTASSSSPTEGSEKPPPREAIAGAMAISAQTVPVATPPRRRRALSAVTMRAK